MEDPEVTVQAIIITPNNCALEEALHLEIDFTTSRDIPSASWRVRFMADTASTRKIVGMYLRSLGTTPIAASLT